MPEMMVVRAGAQTGALDQQGITKAFGGEGVEAGRFGVLVTKAAQIRAHIFAGDPENVWLIGLLGGGGGGGRERSEELTTMHLCRLYHKAYARVRNANGSPSTSGL